MPFELTYFTSGLAWRAFYMGTLSQDEKTMRLEGYVRINNGSGEDYEDAQTRLVVGRVHLLDQIAELAKRQYPYGSPDAFSACMAGWLRKRAGEDTAQPLHVRPRCLPLLFAIHDYSETQGGSQGRSQRVLPLHD